MHGNGIRKLRDYDGMVTHIAIVMSRYIFLSVEQRCHNEKQYSEAVTHTCHQLRSNTVTNYFAYLVKDILNTYVLIIVYMKHLL